MRHTANHHPDGGDNQNAGKKEKEFKERHKEWLKEPTLEERETDIQRSEADIQIRELAVWHREQVAKWEERKRQTEADGREFTEPMPEPPPGINANGNSH